MAEVFARYPNGGGEMLLALAIADHAHDDGTNVRPSVKHLAEKTRQSERTVQYQLRKMENEGWLDLVGNAGGGRNTPREYRINPEWVRGANSAPLQKGATDDTKGCNPRHERVQSTTQRVQPDVLKGATAIAPEPSEPSRTVRATKRKSAPATAVARPDEVQEQVWSDWLTLRKAKRAPVTETVVKQAAAEAAKAGLPLNRFLEIWCARGSQGLQAEWLKPNELDALRGAEPTRPIGKQMQGVMALEEMIRERKHRVAGDGDPARPAAPRLLVSGSDAGR